MISMGDAYDFEMSSDDGDDVSLAEETSIAEDGDFEISDDDDDLMVLTRYQRQLWLRGMVMDVINALDRICNLMVIIVE